MEAFLQIMPIQRSAGVCHALFDRDCKYACFPRQFWESCVQEEMAQGGSNQKGIIDICSFCKVARSFFPMHLLSYSVPATKNIVSEHFVIKICLIAMQQPLDESFDYELDEICCNFYRK